MQLSKSTYVWLRAPNRLVIPEATEEDPFLVQTLHWMLKTAYWKMRELWNWSKKDKAWDRFEVSCEISHYQLTSMPMLPLQSIFILNTRNASLWFSFRKKSQPRQQINCARYIYSSLQNFYSLLIQKDIPTFKLTVLLFQSLRQSGNHFK